MFIINKNLEVKIFTKRNGVISVKTEITQSDLSFKDKYEVSQYSLESSYKKKGYVFFKHKNDILGVKNSLVVEMVGNDLPTEIDDDGNKFWKNSLGQFHRDNGLPAIKYTRGSKYWYVNGQLHRDNDFPACEYVDGTKEWYVNGQLHRDNGLPAIDCADGTKYWWVNGQQVTKEQAACDGKVVEIDGKKFKLVEID